MIGWLLGFCQLLVHLYQLRYAHALGHTTNLKAVSLHHSPVIVLVSLSQLRGQVPRLSDYAQMKIVVEMLAGLWYTGIKDKAI